MDRADNLTTFMCRLSRNSGASTQWNAKGLSRAVAGKLYLYLYSEGFWRWYSTFLKQWKHVCGLLNCERSVTYLEACNFPDHRVPKLRKSSTILCEEWINGALRFRILEGKSPYEVLQWSHGSNMATTCEQTYKLAHLISTIQATTASVERSFSLIS